MIENKIPFIVEGKQVYLPFMAAYLQEKADTERKTKEKFMVSAQVLFLLYMYQKRGEVYLADAVRQLPYSAMTMTRAAKQLEESGLICIRKEGVNKILFSRISKKEMYERGKDFLSSPIVKKGFLNKENLTGQMTLTGTSALADKTMLNSEALLVYAVDKKECNLKELQKELLDPYKQIGIEVWKYSPQLFGKDGTVDTISLALSLLEEKDERIEEAVEEMLNKLWREIDGNRI
ncbi:MAG: MarR family transcriptional regulator [Clostridiales bacterium]|nr:MarR family transcriptional regulator [Clostridiales bacterium]